MGSFDQNSSYIPPFFAVFAQTLGQFPQNVGFCPDFLYIAHLGIPEICAIARKDEFAQKLIFRCGRRVPPPPMSGTDSTQGYTEPRTKSKKPRVVPPLKFGWGGGGHAGFLCK
jgi:hypothetical protein